MDAALGRVHAAQAALATAQPELAKHLAAGNAAFKQFRTAPKTAPPPLLAASLGTAKAEYAAFNAQLPAAQKQATDARDANRALRDILHDKNASPALLKAVGVSSFAEQDTKWTKASAVVSKLMEDQLAVSAAAAQVTAALAAPNSHGPAQCDIRKTDWQNLKYPKSDLMPAFQLKAGSANVDGGPDGMNGGNYTWGFTFVQVDYGDTDANGISEAFVRVDEAGSGYQALSAQILFAFEDDASCTPKPVANVNMNWPTAAHMGPNAYLVTDQDGSSEWRLAGKRLVQTAVGAPLPLCQGGLPPGVFRKSKLSLDIPNNCTDSMQWRDAKNKALSRGGINQEVIDGQAKAVMYSLEGDVCFRYALARSKSGGITVTWQPDLTGSISRNPQVIRNCSANNGEYRPTP